MAETRHGLTGAKKLCGDITLPVAEYERLLSASERLDQLKVLIPRLQEGARGLEPHDALRLVLALLTPDPAEEQA